MISGNFVDENGEPMIYPQIIVKSDIAIIIEATTDIYGNFMFSIVPGNYELILKQFNTELFRKNYNFHANQNLGVIKINNSIRLNEINIVAKRKTIDLKGDRIIYNVVNDPFAVNMTLTDLLKRVPSILIRNEDQIEIVGKNQVRYMLNGRVLELSDDAAKALFKSMNAEDISKVEVITTPPARYSADKNYGFINIVTKKDETSGIKGDTYINLVRKDKTSTFGGLNLNYSNTKLEALLSGNYSNFYSTNLLNRDYIFSNKIQSSRKTTNSDSRMYDINSIIKYDLSDKIEIGAIGNFIKNKMSTLENDMTEYKSYMNEEYQKDSVISTVSNSIMEPDYSLLISSYIDYKIDTVGSLMTLTYNFYNKKSLSTSNISSSINNSTENFHNIISQEGENKYKINSLKLDIIIQKNNNCWEFGGAYTDIKNSSKLDLERDPLIAINDNFTYSEKTAALYLSVDKKINSNLYGKVGLRYEYTQLEGNSNSKQKHNNEYGNLFPSLYLAWNRKNNQSISMAYSMRMDRPYFSDLNPFRYYTTIYNYTSGNPYLLPALSHNLEFKYSNGNSIYSVLYANRQLRAFDYVTIFESSGLHYTITENNFTKDKIGYYLSYNISPFEFLNITMNGDIFYSRFKSQKQELNTIDVDGFGTTLGARSDWILNKKKTLFLHIGYHHMFPKYDNMMKFQSIILLDMNLRYSMMNDKLKFLLRVSDPFKQNRTITEREYRDYTYKSVFDGKPRNVSFTVTYSFGKNKVNSVYRDTKDADSCRSNK